jgi:lipid II:glycine glycyltransferase (peptidoglycan interpeptide bridge formation enzyme)
MTNKEKYIELCSTDPSICIFGQAWWLDAVCQDWDVSIVLDVNENMIGAMPYTFKKRKLNIKTVEMPYLTAFLPIWIKKIKNNQLTSIYSHEHKIMTQLISQLPKVFFFNQYYDYTLDNALPFQWAGYDDTTIYSYLIKLTDRMTILENFKREVRKEIRKAEKIVIIESNDDAGLFYDILLDTYKRLGLTMNYSKDFFLRIDDLLKLKQRRKMYFARNVEDADNDIKSYHSILCVIWDNERMYSFAVGGYYEQMRLSGATTLLYWNAFQDALDLGLKHFDFCHSSTPQIERFKRSFGGARQPYFKMSKFKSPLLGGIHKIIKNR